MCKLTLVLGLLLMTLLPVWGQDVDKQVDKAVLAKMHTGGISLQTATFPIGPNGAKVLVHLYEVPTPQYENGKKVPITQESVATDINAQKSPMYLDLFQRLQGKWTRINTVRFTEEGSAGDLILKWLDPKTKHVPVLLLRYGISDGNYWKIFVFPNGINHRATQQEFLEGGEGDGGVGLAFDAIDSRGLLVVEESWDWETENCHWTSHYAWNGKQFVKSGAYFVVAASVKTEKEAHAFIVKHSLEEANILHSDAYAKLSPGYYVVVLDRCDSQHDAQEAAAFFQKDKVACYVKRAY